MMRKVLLSSSLLLFVEPFPSLSSDCRFSNNRSFLFAEVPDTLMTMVSLGHLLTLFMVARQSDVISPKCPPNSSRMLADRLNG